MNYIQIQQFLVLSKTMNMTKAAKELFITQPALSHSLSKMEEELGLKLVYRDGNRLVLSEEGQMILQDFAEIEKAYQGMFDHAKELHDSKMRKIGLGFCGSIAAFSSLFTYGVLSEYNGVSINKIFADQDAIENMLLGRQIDFAISFPPISGKNIESRVLVRDPIYLAIAGRHPLLKKTRIYIEDLAPYTLLSLTRDNPFQRYVYQLLLNRNTSLRFEEHSYDELMRIIDNGRDSGEVISLTARNQFSSWYGRGYRCLPIEDFQEALITSVSWLRDADFPYEYKGLIDKIESGYDRIYYRNYRNIKPN